MKNEKAHKIWTQRVFQCYSIKFREKQADDRSTSFLALVEPPTYLGSEAALMMLRSMCALSEHLCRSYRKLLNVPAWMGPAERRRTQVPRVGTQRIVSAARSCKAAEKSRFSSITRVRVTSSTQHLCSPQAPSFRPLPWCSAKRISEAACKACFSKVSATAHRKSQLLKLHVAGARSKQGNGIQTASMCAIATKNHHAHEMDNRSCAKPCHILDPLTIPAMISMPQCLNPDAIPKPHKHSYWPKWPQEANLV